GFTKRCAFAMIAHLAVAHRDEPDATFSTFFPLIRSASTDARNEVKKAVNWALRQIGKRNRALHQEAIDEAEALLTLGDPTARWIARDALRELRAPATVARITLLAARERSPQVGRGRSRRPRPKRRSLAHTRDPLPRPDAHVRARRSCRATPTRMPRRAAPPNRCLRRRPRRSRAGASCSHSSAGPGSPPPSRGPRHERSPRRLPASPRPPQQARARRRAPSARAPNWALATRSR